MVAIAIVCAAIGLILIVVAFRIVAFVDMLARLANVRGD